MERLHLQCWIISLISVAIGAMDHLSTQSYLIAQQPTIHIKNGSVVGLRLETLTQDAFLGIPYAKPPVGKLRFRHPQSLNQKWDGVLQATKYGHTCSQYSSITDVSEDCLTLNGEAL
jgi:Carboxylesterase family